MVICAIVEYNNCSDDSSGISFFSILKVTDRYGKAELELQKRQRGGFLAAISRKELDLTALNKYKVCERHLHSGKPVYLYKTTNPDWLPTLHLASKEHSSAAITPADTARVDRWKRVQERENWKRIEELLPALVTDKMPLIVTEEILGWLLQSKKKRQGSISNQQTIMNSPV